MNKMYQVALIIVTVALLVNSVSIAAIATELDDSIESAARNSYVFNTYLKNDDIRIKSIDGVVTLKGSVVDEPRKSLAKDTVANLAGVKSVDNQLEVKGKSADLNSEAWITAKVKAALLFHRNVNAMTEVTTKDGIVTLQGEEDSQAQKDLTTKYVKDVEGVKDVQNKIKHPVELQHSEGSDLRKKEP